MNTITVYQTSAEDLKSFIENEAEKRVESFTNRFKSVFVGADDVARIHGVSKQTVYNHAKRGEIISEIREAESGAFRFRLSEVLKLDFDKLRKRI